MKQQKSYHQKGKGNRILRRALSLILCAVMIAGTAPESLAGILAVKDNVATTKAAAGTPATHVAVGSYRLKNMGIIFRLTTVLTAWMVFYGEMTI